MAYIFTQGSLFVLECSPFVFFLPQFYVYVSFVLMAYIFTQGSLFVLDVHLLYFFSRNSTCAFHLYSWPAFLLKVPYLYWVFTFCTFSPAILLVRLMANIFTCDFLFVFVDPNFHHLFKVRFYLCLPFVLEAPIFSYGSLYVLFPPLIVLVTQIYTDDPRFYLRRLLYTRNTPIPLLASPFVVVLPIYAHDSRDNFRLLICTFVPSICTLRPLVRVAPISAHGSSFVLVIFHLYTWHPIFTRGSSFVLVPPICTRGPLFYSQFSMLVTTPRRLPFLPPLSAAA